MTGDEYWLALKNTWFSTTTYWDDSEYWKAMKNSWFSTTTYWDDSEYSEYWLVLKNSWFSTTTYWDDSEYWLVLRNSWFSTTTYWDDSGPSQSQYRRWAPSEPDADTKTCVYYHTGGLFHDSYCSAVSYKYTCKMRVGELV